MKFWPGSKGGNRTSESRNEVTTLPLTPFMAEL
jgi:hypothetical protein